MNLGQFLTAKSPLPTGTVAQHLAAIAELQAGSGQGTVFASMFSVQVERNEIVVSRKAKRSVPDAIPAAQPARLPTPGKSDNKLSVFTVQPSVTVLTAPDEITLTQKTASLTVTNRLPSASITRKRKSGLVQSV